MSTAVVPKLSPRSSPEPAGARPGGRSPPKRGSAGHPTVRRHPGQRRLQLGAVGQPQLPVGPGEQVAAAGVRRAGHHVLVVDPVAPQLVGQRRQLRPGRHRLDQAYRGGGAHGDRGPARVDAAGARRWTRRRRRPAAVHRASASCGQRRACSGRSRPRQSDRGQRRQLAAVVRRPASQASASQSRRRRSSSPVPEAMRDGHRRLVEQRAEDVLGQAGEAGDRGGRALPQPGQPHRPVAAVPPGAGALVEGVRVGRAGRAGGRYRPGVQPGQHRSERARRRRPAGPPSATAPRPPPARRRAGGRRRPARPGTPPGRPGSGPSSVPVPSSPVSRCTLRRASAPGSGTASASSTSPRTEEVPRSRARMFIAGQPTRQGGRRSQIRLGRDGAIGSGRPAGRVRSSCPRTCPAGGPPTRRPTPARSFPTRPPDEAAAGVSPASRVAPPAAPGPRRPR